MPRWSTITAGNLSFESAGIVKAIYTYSKTLGWCDIAGALVDKYGQVFEGSAGGLTKPGRRGSHRRIQPQHLGLP